MKKRSKSLYIILSCVILHIAFTLLLANYTKDYYQLLTSSSTKLVGTNEIEIVKTRDYYKISKTNSFNDTAFVFYPGALVESQAYIEMALQLANDDIDVYLEIMPHYLALFKSNAVIDIVDLNPQIDNWYLAGHSLGGSVASTNFKDSRIKGLVLLGSYPLTKNLPDKPILSIRGSNDQVINIDNYNDYLGSNQNVSEYVIEGGNHGFFGEYGHQAKDGNATISNLEQITQTVDYINDFINKVN
ncbi:MAG: alpha/beta family hydrolase [Bacilli bacterium]